MAANGFAPGDVANERELSSFGEDKYFREKIVQASKIFGNDRLACVSGCLLFDFHFRQYFSRQDCLIPELQQLLT